MFPALPFFPYSLTRSTLTEYKMHTLYVKERYETAACLLLLGKMRQVLLQLFTNWI